MIKKLLLLYTLTLLKVKASVLSLWPYPSEVFNDDKCVRLNPEFSFTSESKSTILKDSFIRYKNLSRVNTNILQPCSVFLSSIISEVNIFIESKIESLGPDTNESYSLIITNTKINLTSLNVYGAIRGLETFSQLLFIPSLQGQLYIPIVNIKDYPRFSFRAILIDTSRLFRPINILKQMIDTMSWSKFNMLILHLTDDQAWTIEIKNYPNLTIKCLHGTNQYHPLGGVRFYSQNEMKDLVNYAKNRGIRMIAEIDNPGHIDVLKRCYPELLAFATCPAPGTDSNCRNGISKGFRSTPDISNPKWWDFYKNVVKELSTIFFDPYFSIGGDEFWQIPWNYSPSVQEFLKINNITNPIDWYSKTVQNITKNANKTALMWTPGIPSSGNTINMIWYGWVGNRAGISNWRDAFSRITITNRRVILAGRWYLGMEPNPNNKTAPWINPDWKVWYKTDPHDFQGTIEQKNLVLGGMGTIWSDLVKLDIYNRSWPLMNSIGEQLWSLQNITNLPINMSTVVKRYDDHKKRIDSRRNHVSVNNFVKEDISDILGLTSREETISFKENTNLKGSKIKILRPTYNETFFNGIRYTFKFNYTQTDKISVRFTSNISYWLNKNLSPNNWLNQYEWFSFKPISGSVISTVSDSSLVYCPSGLGYLIFTDIEGNYDYIQINLINSKFQTPSVIYKSPPSWNTNIPINWCNTNNPFGRSMCTPVKTQKCGCCWAYNSATLLETSYSIANNLLIPSIMPPEQIMTCVPPRLPCKGGSDHSGMRYGLKNGMQIENEYPPSTYKYIYNNTNIPLICNDTKNIKYKFTDFCVYKSKNITTIKKFLTLFGSAMVGTDGNIYYIGKNLINSNLTCSVKNINHAVNLVGWSIENKTEYWIIRNSWGPSWGMNGFAKIIIDPESNPCGILDGVTFTGPCILKENNHLVTTGAHTTHLVTTGAHTTRLVTTGVPSNVPLYCNLYGFPSIDKRIRLYTKYDCQILLNGIFISGGECLIKSGGSYSWNCRNLN